MNNLENTPSDSTSKPKDKLNIKLITICLSIVLVFGIIFSFTTLSYKSLVVNFKSYFDNAHYSTANNLIVTKGNMNLLKSIKIDSDLKSYFKEKLSTITKKLNSKELSNDDALIIINEINRYNLLDSEIDEVVNVLSNNVSGPSALTEGISEFQKGNFKEALTLFNSIPSNNEGYSTAITYIAKCKDGYISALIKEADDLASKDHYTDAITLLEKSLIENDNGILTKIESLKQDRDEFIKLRDKNNK